MAKRKELEVSQPEVKQSARARGVTESRRPLRAADRARTRWDPRSALKARQILRQLFNGKIVRRPGPDHSLWAEYDLQPGALVRVGTGGGPCRDRTYDQEIKSLLLYQLS